MRLAVILVLAACAPAATMRAAVPPAVAPELARVVFVHHAGPAPGTCAAPCRPAPRGYHPAGSPTLRIIDEDGELLGDSYVGTAIAATLAPGEHTLVGWVLGADEVTVVRASLAAGRTYYVDVVTDRVVATHGHSVAPWRSTFLLDPMHREAGVDRAMLLARVRWIEVAGDPFQLVADRDVRAHLGAARTAAAGTLDEDDGE